MKHGRQCPCDRCRADRNRYERHRTWHKHCGRAYLVPADGTRRRIQALLRIGWRARDLAAELGITATAVTNLSKPSSPTTKVRRVTATRMAALYDRLSMTPGPSKQGAARAAAKGWPPPLAWDDGEIDDPDARPSGVPRTKAA